MEGLGIAALVMRALEKKEGISAEKHLGLGRGEEQRICALTAAWDQSKSRISFFHSINHEDTCILTENITMTYLAHVFLLGFFKVLLFASVFLQLYEVLECQNKTDFCQRFKN